MKEHRWELIGFILTFVKQKSFIMKYIYLLFILISFQSFAGSNYNAKFVFLEELSGEPIKGITVELRNTDEEIIQTKNTDMDGAVVFESISLKWIELIVKDENGKYEETYFRFNNSKKKNLDSKIKLRFSYQIEYDMQSKKMESRNSKYPSPDDPMLVSYNAKDKKFDNCSEEDLVEATFKDGVAAFQKYISENIYYPQRSIEKNEQGKIYVSFIIEKDGVITNVEIVKGASIDLDRESRRVVFNMPNWEPAKCNGEIVRFKSKIPINFTLN